MLVFPNVYDNPAMIPPSMSERITGALNRGLHILKQSVQSFINVPDEPGNYIISANGYHYTGQANSLSSRLSFYYHEDSEVFRKYYKKYGMAETLHLSDLTVCYMPVYSGKKELEEFVIVNLPAEINSSNKRAQSKFTGSLEAKHTDDWICFQNNSTAMLSAMKETADKLPFIRWHEAEQIIDKFKGFGGVYVIKDKDGYILYVGETSTIRQRYTQHSKRTRISIFRRNVAVRKLGYTLKNSVSLETLQVVIKSAGF